MQIHELDNFTDALGSGVYAAVDDGNNTGKVSIPVLLQAVNAELDTLNDRIDNIISSPAPSAQEVTDARLGANGKTYTSLGAAIRGQIDDLRYRAVAMTDGIDVSTSGVTSLYLFAGETAIIDVQSITGRVNCYIEGYTSTGVKLLSVVGTVEYTAANNGHLQFYFLSGASMTAHITLKTDLGETVENMSGDVNNLIDANFATGGLNLEVGAIDTGYGTNAANNTRLRTISYIDAATAAVFFDPSYVAQIFAYDTSGTYVGAYTGQEFSKDWQVVRAFPSPINISEFKDYNYIYRLVFIIDGGTATEEGLEASTELSYIKMMQNSGGETYTVGAGYDFDTFTDMLIALDGNSNKKTVYVMPGEYDIFEEMGGAEYMASLDTSDLGWRDVSHIVPPNTTIVGMGEVVLSWNPTDAEIIDQAHAFLFSPLNLSGTASIKNITIRCSNCRYGIHDESSGRSVYDGIVRELENVKVYYSESTYGVRYAYGAGHNKNSQFKYKNCVFSAAYGNPWSMHDWTVNSKEENSLFVFDNCVLIDNRTNTPAKFRFSSDDQTGRLDEVAINGSVFSGIHFGTEGSQNVKQGYAVTTMLCKSFATTYTDLILEADRVAPKEYLTIA